MKIFSSRWLGLALGLGVCGASLPVQAQFMSSKIKALFGDARSREIPAPKPLIDETGKVDPDSARKIESMLRDQESLAHGVVWVVDDLRGEAVEVLALRAAEQWKLGSADKDNGFVVLVAMNDRQVRVETGRGLEGALPDILIGRMIRDVVAPAFRKEQYGQGIGELVQNIFGRLGVEFGAEASFAQPSGERRALPDAWVILLVVVLILLARLSGFVGQGRGGSAGFRRRRYFDSGGFGGGFGGGLGGGGGWSGGGGSFGGGGASGRW